MSKAKQTDRVLEYIEQNGSITQLEALNELGVMRLASRISDLKKQGYPIVSKIEAVKNRYDESCHIKRYSLGIAAQPVKVTVRKAVKRDGQSHYGGRL